ncbi:hypothetical protein FD754_003626 [Muntiacus muntjak]|uniref:Uncharacterized protein n=1 Tax=Muntiacus muntjak TaxID=9888 RepID=A0A5N3WCK6_MUNMU|nr:hypothetical protein FD754_003626 [Muntiacus muntjak]
MSENVVNRMKDPGQPSRVGPLDPPAAALGSSGGREKDSKPPRPECGSGQGPLRVQVDPLERCDREQAVLQHELVHVATTDREAAAKPRSVTLRRGEGSADQEKQRLAQLLWRRVARPQRRLQCGPVLAAASAEVLSELYVEGLGRRGRMGAEPDCCLAFKLSSAPVSASSSCLPPCPRAHGRVRPRRVPGSCRSLPVLEGPGVRALLPAWVWEGGENRATLLLLTPSPWRAVAWLYPLPLGTGLHPAASLVPPSLG